MGPSMGFGRRNEFWLVCCRLHLFKEVPNLGVLNHQLIHLSKQGSQHWWKAPNQVISLFSRELIFWDSILACSVFFLRNTVGLGKKRRLADSARHPFHETKKPHTMRCFKIVLFFLLDSTPRSLYIFIISMTFHSIDYCFYPTSLSDHKWQRWRIPKRWVFSAGLETSGNNLIGCSRNG